jgi:hypothetical protein
VENIPHRQFGYFEVEQALAILGASPTSESEKCQGHFGGFAALIRLPKSQVIDSANSWLLDYI